MVMVTKTIVGVAGTAADRDAVALARALTPDGELVLTCAYPYDEAPSRFLMLGYGNALRDATRQEITRLRDDAGVPDARIELVADLSPARALHKIAEREHAGLVVVGSSHRGRLGRTLLGDVARAALHGSPCPVAVAPQGYEAGPIRGIGVAFDGSRESEAALAFAAVLAAEHSARLSLRTAVAPTIGMAGAGGYAVTIGEIVESLRAEAQERLDAAVAVLDVEADGAARPGPPNEVLDSLCADSDLVVAGSRTWGTARRLALGSTADRLIHHAPCPVVVVPRGAAVPEATAAQGAHAGAESAAR
jgi:nucleotide-binding universal stress UspA family protein